MFTSFHGVNIPAMATVPEQSWEAMRRPSCGISTLQIQDM